MLGLEEWRCATLVSGEQCVMMSGAEWMLKWPADSLDMLLMASPLSICDTQFNVFFC